MNEQIWAWDCYLIFILSMKWSITLEINWFFFHSHFLSPVKECILSIILIIIKINWIICGNIAKSKEFNRKKCRTSNSRWLNNKIDQQWSMVHSFIFIHYETSLTIKRSNFYQTKTIYIPKLLKIDATNIKFIRNKKVIHTPTTLDCVMRNPFFCIGLGYIIK